MGSYSTAALIGIATQAGWFRERWALLAVLAVVAVAVIFLLAFARYLRLSINMFLDTPLPVTANMEDYEKPTGEVQWFRSLDGHHLRGMFVEPNAGRGKGPDTDSATVIFCHEFGSDMYSVGRYASGLMRAGFRIFTFDFRGHGESFSTSNYEPRHWPSEHEVKDILAAVAFVKSQAPDADRGVGILGISRGAAAAVCAAAVSPYIRCLVLDGLFSTDHTIEDLMKKWSNIFARIDIGRASQSDPVYRLLRAMTLFYVELKLRCRYPSTKKALTKLNKVPILAIQGERDTYIRVEQTRALYDIMTGSKELWIVPGAKHNQAVVTQPEKYRDRIVEFFQRHLVNCTLAPSRKDV
ncbi:MAG: alpha/beta fold hydrolase [Planctomycetia bacterium]|nr:alpha/beta fold hydrolase [Planctomycetia bacterium]